MSRQALRRVRRTTTSETFILDVGIFVAELYTVTGCKEERKFAAGERVYEPPGCEVTFEQV